MRITIRRVALVATLSTLIPARVHAQPVYFAVDPIWYSGPTRSTHSVAVGDVDGDGDLDLVCGNLNQINTLYLNHNGVFDENPSWSSQQANATTSIALGDVDGDGDLDLVCGNQSQNNTLYLNDGGTFGRTPAWESRLSSATVSVALGDIDGDGDLDLVCGNLGQRNTIYLNTNGAFGQNPNWTSAQAYFTTSVALGDIDGDGYLDVVCGNRSGTNTLYLNDGGTVGTSPAWFSDPTNDTESIALGDVDGDGDFDLVCGNGTFPSNQKNTLYLNEGGTFARTPAWVSGPSYTTESVALGDIDGDGDLDLVCGNDSQSQSSIVYRNDGTGLADSSWASQPRNLTRSIALADIDGDGNLDLICGNRDHNNTLYLNAGGMAQTPTWSSIPTNFTTSVALGDVNGDGMLDLVCGNSKGCCFENQSNTFYPNENGALLRTPTWSSGPANSTRSVTLGDIDLDGDLDLVCGNNGQGNTLYLNESGTLADTVSWTSDPANATWGIALVDANLNGYLGVVCANRDQRNTAYINLGGTFSPGPGWFTGPANTTFSVAVGDINGDGYPDAAFGNWGSNIVYINGSGPPPVAPSWLSGPTNVTRSVALGDIDGDGDLDLVCGNQDQSNTLYLNAGGTLENIPVWSSGPANRTVNIALGDIDGDGDLDLACANQDQSNTVYRNVGGEFSQTPVWLSGPTNSTTSVALGDIDGDGDLDLVCGNDGQSNTLYANLGRPLYKFDPAVPTHHLPNNSAYLRFVDVEDAGENLKRVTFAVIDVESDSVWVVPEYQFEGAPTWFAGEIAGGGNKLGLLATSPAGVEHALEWDISRVPFDSRPVVLRLRIISVPSSVSIIHHVDAYLKSVGPLEPMRPEITTSASSLSFATMTIGDRDSLDFTVRNTGNSLLGVSAIDLPSPEMRLSRSTPFDISPGDEVTITLFLEPRTELDIAGDVRITSDDPVTPVATIPVTTDILAIDVETELLTQSDVIPLGEAVTITVTPAPEVHMDGGYVFHQPVGTEGPQFPDSILLSPKKTGFIAIIPGEAVTEVGLEYYVKMKNGRAFATDPPGAPADSVFSQAVESPTSIASVALPNTGERFVEGQGIRVQVTLPDGAVFESGGISFRRGGGTTYERDSLQVGDPLPFAIVPDSIVGSRGVEYWVDVHTATQTLTDPSVDPTDRPYSIPVIVRDLLEPLSHTGGQYRLLSIPLSMQGSALESLSNEFLVKFGVDAAQWRCFTHVGGGAYTEFKGNSSGTFGFEQGRAYWLISRDRHRIDTGPDQGETAPTDRPFEITLDEGYNLIGNPFNFAVDWSLMQVDTFTFPDAVRDGKVEYPVGVVGGRYDYYDDSNNPPPPMVPFDGYWLKNLTQQPVVLRIPPVEAAENGAAVSRESVAEEATAPGDWRIEISSQSGSIGGQTAVVGIRSGAAAEWDAFDRSMVPMPPGDQMAVYVPHHAWERKGPYAFDFRDGYEEGDGGNTWGQRWAFDVAKSYTDAAAGDEVVLGFDGLDKVPPEVTIRLIDRKLDRSVDLQSKHRYAYFQRDRSLVADEDDVRFVLLVGSEAYVSEQSKQLAPPPTITTLHQNYPNPFNPSTIIRYELASAGHVRLRVYDVSGALVKVLEDRERPPGRYEIGWDGENESGSLVSSGVYFYRLRAGSFSQTRKMLLLK